MSYFILISFLSFFHGKAAGFLILFPFYPIGLSGSLIAVFSLAVLYEFMSSYQSYLDLPAAKRSVIQESSTTRRFASVSLSQSGRG